MAETLRVRVPAQVNIGVQTNGTLLDDEWAVFVAENDVLVRP